jgi:hypothetical protein
VAFVLPRSHAAAAPRAPALRTEEAKDWPR